MTVPHADDLSVIASWQVYKIIRDELASGGRVYIVCPLVGSTLAADNGGGGGGVSASR